MGNYKFRISDMIPNAWVHKLKDMTKPKHKPSSSSKTCSKKKPSSQSLHQHSSTSYYLSKSLVSIDPHTNSPRISLHTRVSKRKTLYKPSPKPSLPSEGFNKSKINGQDSSSHCSIPALKSSPESFVFSFYENEDDEFAERDFTKQKVKESVSVKKACHASNLTEEPRKHNLIVKINKEKEEEEDDECRFKRKYEKQVSSGRKSSAGINLKRVNSPRIHQLSGTRKSTSRTESNKQAVLESFAVVKRSVDPKKDFRDSMLEMIEENNIKASKDFEDLLACYLSLNPNQYHDLIIQVFEQLWRQLIKTK